MNKKRNIRFSTMQILAAGFFGIIFIGGILLWLPISNTQPISFVNALFTATTAVCVTGLVTITPAVQFTLFGKAVLLLLIQIGGLGIIACAVSFFILLKKRISIRDRIVILETYNMDTLSGMVAMIIRILKGTAIVEGAGALCYSLQFVPEFGFWKGVGYSVFHSVSAFCNAGIDILGDSSFMDYVTNPIVNFTTMTLIVLSGLGFPVWHDMLFNLKKIKKEELPVRKYFHRLRLHTKLVLVMTTILIVGGTVNFLILEYSNPGTFGNLSFGQKIMASMFHSISTRTAGFATVPQDNLTNGSLFTTCILMFIGGSPGGTAGGVKTTTVAMLIMYCITFIKGGEDTECFGRRIKVANIKTGFSVFMISFITLIVGTALVSIFESGVGLERVLYETTSAIGTVGLSANLTPTLGTDSKFVIMALMYLGRIGPITMALAFGARKNSRDKIRQLPSQGIMVG